MLYVVCAYIVVGIVLVLLAPANDPPKTKFQLREMIRQRNLKILEQEKLHENPLKDDIEIEIEKILGEEL